MKNKEEKTKDLRAKCNNIFYDKDSRKEIEEAKINTQFEYKKGGHNMKIKITGNRCIGCYKYSQYYTISGRGELEAIDCGYCGIRQCTTRPGNRCKEYREKSNVGLSEEQLLRLQLQK